MRRTHPAPRSLPVRASARAPRSHSPPPLFHLPPHAQAGRILANLLVAGAGVLIRAGTQAYKQALISACFSFFGGGAGVGEGRPWTTTTTTTRTHTSPRRAPILPPFPLADANKTGAAADVASSAAAKAGMALDEAHKILGTAPGASREELLRRATHLFRANDEAGSFYLTSKVFRARERIEAEVGPLEGGGDGAGGGGGGAGGGGGGADPPPQGRVGN